MEEIILPQEICDFLDYQLNVNGDVKAVDSWVSHATEFDEANGTKVFNYLIDLDNRRNYFMAALTDCYEVEKEQLYYVKFINEKFAYLNKGLKYFDGNYIVSDKFDGNYIISDKEESERFKTKFTEKEIKEMDERYWKFAVKVEVDDE